MFKVFAIALVLFATSTAASAGCIVTDPRGAPLHIRKAPNGKIIGTLKNGASVEFLSTAYDRNGKVWADIGVGWVNREFVDCYATVSRS